MNKQINEYSLIDISVKSERMAWSYSNTYTTVRTPYPTDSQETIHVYLFIYYNAFIGVPLYILNLSNAQSSVHKNSGLRIFSSPTVK